MFDWNGTILNDIVLSHGSAVEILKAFAPGKQLPTLEQFRREMTLNFMQFYRNWGVPKDITAEELEVYRKKYFEEHRNNVELTDGAMEFMKLCRKMGMKVAIISGENQAILQKNVGRWFRARVRVHYTFGSVREKETVLMDILNAEKLSPEEAFYVGDSPGDVIATNNVGITSVALWHGGSYTSEEKLRASAPKYFVTSFDEAAKILL